MVRSFSQQATLYLLLMMTSSIVVAQSISPEQNTDHRIVEHVWAVFSADLFTAALDGWPDSVKKPFRIKIKDLITPSNQSPCPLELQMARQGKDFLYRSLKSAKVIQLINIKEERYFNLESDVYVDGINIGQALIQKGYASHKENPWCKKGAIKHSKLNKQQNISKPII